MTGVLPVFFILLYAVFFFCAVCHTQHPTIRSIPTTSVISDGSISISPPAAIKTRTGTDIFTDRKPSSEEDNPNTPINEVIKI